MKSRDQRIRLNSDIDKAPQCRVLNYKNDLVRTTMFLSIGQCVSNREGNAHLAVQLLFVDVGTFHLFIFHEGRLRQEDFNRRWVPNHALIRRFLDFPHSVKCRKETDNWLEGDEPTYQNLQSA